MATGPEHYVAAERLIAAARDLGTNSAEVAEKLGKPGADMVPAIKLALAEAQVHAILALAAATARAMPHAGAATATDTEYRSWNEVLDP